MTFEYTSGDGVAIPRLPTASDISSAYRKWQTDNKSTEEILAYAGKDLAACMVEERESSSSQLFSSPLNIWRCEAVSDVFWWLEIE